MFTGAQPVAHTSQAYIESILTRPKRNRWLVVLELYSEWCGPCKSVLPTLKRLRTDKDDEACLQFLLVRCRTARHSATGSLVDEGRMSQAYWLRNAAGRSASAKGLCVLCLQNARSRRSACASNLRHLRLQIQGGGVRAAGGGEAAPRALGALIPHVSGAAPLVPFCDARLFVCLVGYSQGQIFDRYNRACAREDSWGDVHAHGCNVDVTLC